MKLTANNLQKVIREKKELLRAGEIAFANRLPYQNPHSIMDEIFSLHSDLMELRNMLAIAMHTQVKVLGEPYTICECMSWVASVYQMADLWAESQEEDRGPEWSKLIDYLKIYQQALIDAEDVLVEFDVDPALFKGTSLQKIIDAQVL